MEEKQDQITWQKKETEYTSSKVLERDNEKWARKNHSFVSSRLALNPQSQLEYFWCFSVGGSANALGV